MSFIKVTLLFYNFHSQKKNNLLAQTTVGVFNLHNNEQTTNTNAPFGGALVNKRIIDLPTSSRNYAEPADHDHHGICGH